MFVAVGAALVLGLATAAVAETYRDPVGVVGVGTNGSDAGTASDWSTVAVSQGGCAHGTAAVAVGESGRHCGACEYHGCWGDGEAEGVVAVGLQGGEAAGTIAAADSGDTSSCDSFSGITSGSNCLLFAPPTAVSVTGTAIGMTAVSGTGNASTWNGTAVSGTGTAFGYCDDTWNRNSVAVTGTGAAYSCIAVSGTGPATSEGCTGDPLRDASYGVAVSVAGDASGCTSVSVLGDAGALAP